MRCINKFWLGSFLGLCVFGLSACKKGTVVTSANNQLNTLSAFVQSNYDLTHYDTALLRNHLLGTLSGIRDFTVFAPVNEGFPTYRGVFASQSNYYYAFIQNGLDPGILDRFSRYTIASGKITLSQMPIAYNSPISTIGGDSLYLTKVVKNGDSIYTINGSLVTKHDIKVSNGFAHVIANALYPPPNTNIYNVISGSQNVSIIGGFGNSPIGGTGQLTTDFANLVYQSGLSDMLSKGGPYTLFAPKSIDGVNLSTRADSVKFVLNHMIRGRYFLNDFLLRDIGFDTLTYSSLTGEPLRIVPYTDLYNGNSILFYVIGKGNTQPAIIQSNPFQRLGDIVTRNGNIQIIDQPLIP